MKSWANSPAVATLAFLAAGCASTAGVNEPMTGPTVVQPGAPGAPSQVRTEEELRQTPGPRYSEYDVTFMQEMIGHHQQALDMTALVPSRTESRDLRLLAQRIELSQRAEIELMRNWLERRGEAMPGPGGHMAHAPDARMPHGMLNQREMGELEAATGPDFERLFLLYMIRHHQGAVAMVDDLFDSPAGGQEPEIFQFAAGVAADQPIEISRMQRMLAQLY